MRSVQATEMETETEMRTNLIERRFQLAIRDVDVDVSDRKKHLDLRERGEAKKFPVADAVPPICHTPYSAYSTFIINGNRRRS